MSPSSAVGEHGGMRSAPACDLDPAVFNLATAFYDARQGCWRAPKHGVGLADVLSACGCPVCVAVLDRRAAGAERPPAPPVRRPSPFVAVDDTRARVQALIGAGWSRTAIAVAAGLDQATVDRVLRPDVQRIRVESAAGILAVTGDPPPAARRHLA